MSSGPAHLRCDPWCLRGRTRTSREEGSGDDIQNRACEVSGELSIFRVVSQTRKHYGVASFDRHLALDMRVKSIRTDLIRHIRLPRTRNFPCKVRSGLDLIPHHFVAMETPPKEPAQKVTGLICPKCSRNH